MWFSTPADFNDPFDCKTRCIVYDRSEGDYAQYAENVMRRHFPGASAEEVRRKATLAAADPGRGATLGKYLQADVDRLGIFSVSTVPDHPLLWSHYAYGHTGLCLEFKCDGLFPDQTVDESLCPIRYSKRFPLVSEAADPHEQVEAVLLTKAFDWQYEAEGRYLDWQRGTGYRRFAPDHLTRVIFGCRLTQADRHRVRAWVVSGNTSPRFFEAVVREREYALDINPAD